MQAEQGDFPCSYEYLHIRGKIRVTTSWKKQCVGRNTTGLWFWKSIMRLQGYGVWFCKDQQEATAIKK